MNELLYDRHVCLVCGRQDDIPALGSRTLWHCGQRMSVIRTWHPTGRELRIPTITAERDAS